MPDAGKGTGGGDDLGSNDDIAGGEEDVDGATLSAIAPRLRSATARYVTGSATAAGSTRMIRSATNITTRGVSTATSTAGAARLRRLRQA
jgi:hypothetical protein